ncbi:agmatine deiminase family protein [Belliella sp. R4-6]|uniref:Agmatine deiminase family protein n=1 Tax=Belliella alkalica TaxID=1730871 RepID=A0ABS9VEW1_9BACT|nr:agmatine deiminase family protein [Belliella alkalica]MCH7414977.1 agmatine deiminase family protein [Belliella alkalica]
MKNLTLFVFLIVVISSCKKEQRDPALFYYPAEWEPQEAMLMGWTERQPEFFPLVVDLARALEGSTSVIFVSDTSENPVVFKEYLLENGLDTAAYTFISLPVWQAVALRDVGPVYLVNGLGDTKAVDYSWSFQDFFERFLIEKGVDPDTAKADASFFNRNQKTDSLIAAREGLEVLVSPLNLDGGAIEVNGKGSILLNEDWMFKVNPELSKLSIEEELKRTLGVHHFIWVGKGLVEDSDPTEFIVPGYVAIGTAGHTDEYIRFANANTILLAWVDEEEKDVHPVHAENYRRLQETYDILVKAKDQDGKPFKIIKVPLPDLRYRSNIVVEGWAISDSTIGNKYFLPHQKVALGDTLQYLSASSYLNFLISNDKVLLPTYLAVDSSAEKEEHVKEIFSSLYPDKQLVWIDATVYNWGGGGIHCYTKQVPKAN